MSFVRGEGQPKVCPKTGRIIRTKSKLHFLKWLFPITGIFALIWFLVRVIPKPSRATYPCQRVAFPVASSFIIWLLGALGSIVAFRKAKLSIARARYVVASVCILMSVGLIWAAISTNSQKIIYAHEPLVSNAPLGTAIGVNPGRVAWIHDANATDWGGPGTAKYWYDSDATDQTVVNQMVSKALRALTDTTTDHAAWDAIFREFNQQHGRGDVGYTSGEKIGIKVNMTLTFEGYRDKRTPSWWGGSEFLDLIDNSPQLTIALLHQLVNVVGVSESDISIGDPVRVMPDYYYNIVHAEFPNVVYIDPVGGEGRTQPQASIARFYWSDPDSGNFVGVTEDDYIPDCFADAAYFINFPILKSHDGSGITISGKNHYGSVRGPQDAGYYDLHITRAADTPGMGHYRAMVDLMGHPELGGKTLISLVDALFAGISWSSEPVEWDMAPFNGDWPSSIFISQDQVAVDSVGFDFLYEEWTDYPHMSGADDYLHEAALADDPCSGATYDPNNDGGPIDSLGAHEHWNNATDKQYTRNLETGDGIELSTEVPASGDFDDSNGVDFPDFATFAAAWGTVNGDADFDPNCDISIPSDGVIDALDLGEFSKHWLNGIIGALIEPGASLQQVYYDSGVYFEGPTWDTAGQKLFFFQKNRYETNLTA